MSRAQWLAFGSTLAAVGCSDPGTAGPTVKLDATASGGDAATHVEGGGDVAAPFEGEAGGTDARDASEDVTSPEAADADAAIDLWGLAAGDGSFVCLQAPYAIGIGAGYADASLICDRATQFCNLYSVGGDCVSLSTWCPINNGPDASCSYHPFEPKPGACDGGILRCACLTGCFVPPNTDPMNTRLCTDDGAGGITIACHACYGAPPARLERLAV